MDAVKFQAFALISFVCLLAQSLPSTAVTNQQDVNALNALAAAWSSTSFSWSGDPCQDSWLGVTCDSDKTMVIKLNLPNMGISGTLPTQIGNLVHLEALDLSYSADLKGSLPSQLFQLTNLSGLFLQNCGFVGTIPQDLGNLTGLTYLALNNNFFTGSIPTNIGQLSQLIWFDLSNNQLTGNLPSTLSQLTEAQHFHLQANQFSGVIPSGIFNSKMRLIHLLLHNNSFQGEFPADVGNLTNLDILRLDFNSFSSIPGMASLASTVTSVQLDHNQLSGDVPDLSNLVSMQILDLGHNQFNPGPVPSWFSKFQNLSSIAMEAGNLEGPVSAAIFSLSNLESVMLRNNSLNGTLDLRNAGPSLTEVDFQQNNISGLLGNFSGTLNLQGNLICLYNPNTPDNACNPNTTASSSVLPLPTCSCPEGSESNPTAADGGCLCAYPVDGLLVFTALKVTLDSKVVPILQSGFQTNIPIITAVKQVSISIVSTQVANISIFPDNTTSWDLSLANIITSLLSSKAILFPNVGPYEYIPFGVYSPAGSAKAGLSAGDKAGIGVGVAVLAVLALIVGTYALVQKKRADRAEEISKPFASFLTSGEDNGEAPKLKGARLFTLAEIQRATNNFSKNNEIGAGGYGKVYKGVLPSGEKVAIKRSQASSQQGAAEFKNEIELLSRVHHRNLVGLVGFCFEEQMLIYEYMPNGTMRESLSGSSNVQMDWQRRLAIALGSAKGLAYLHTEAYPPIIHRDVKSSNILLDEKLVAKVADFGLSKLAPDDGGTGAGHVSTQVKGTLGYLDPEYYTTQRLSDKSDVYSFGVVLLELITAKQPIEQGNYIVREVKKALNKGGLPSVELLLDPQLTDCPRADLEVFLGVALRSVEETADSRPTMSEVAKELETLVFDDRVGSRKRSGAFNFSDHERQEPLYLPEDSFQYSGGYAGPFTVEPK